MHLKQLSINIRLNIVNITYLSIGEAESNCACRLQHVVCLILFEIAFECSCVPYVDRCFLCFVSCLCSNLCGLYSHNSRTPVLSVNNSKLMPFGDSESEFIDWQGSNGWPRQKPVLTICCSSTTLRRVVFCTVICRREKKMHFFHSDFCKRVALKSRGSRWSR